MQGQYRSSHPLLSDDELATLRQLDDTSFLAVGHFDCTACHRLAGLGLVQREADDYWKITPEGRNVAQSRG
ncbi:MAG TPA: hypothetical protein VM621_14245 [Luteibacter sp.]|uniref:hypothetical protein n=1 Tax=Luteibacter sp. TaxID=1886636 RepID=UPI002C9EB819|nr:hypothetical protein [Luteibacter sp.]HVI56199.1 hypothetical protein [Luteibacter sp.]